MRGVEEGESYTVTRRGVPVALLTPTPADIDLRCLRPSRTRPSFVDRGRVRLSSPSAALLDDLRGDR